MLFSIPVWENIDISAAISQLMALLGDLWVWSGRCGIIWNGELYPWRNILIAGLVFGKFVSVFANQFVQDRQESIAYADDYFNGRIRKDWEE